MTGKWSYDGKRGPPEFSKAQMGDAGIAAVVSAVVSRLTIGSLCDIIGPRLATMAVLFMTAIPTFCMMAIKDFGGFVAMRFTIGLGLSVFVCCQYW